MRPYATDKPQILVVDDDLMSLEMLQGILAEDYKVITARSGQEALDLLDSLTPDLFMLDIVMPGMDGYTLFQRIRKLPLFLTTPILFMSTLGEPASVSLGLVMGACDYITKPFNAHTLRLRIKNQLLLKHQADLIKEQQRELQMRESFFQQIFHSHSAPFLLIEPDTGTIIDSNRGASEFYGYTHEELSGMPVTEINMLPPRRADQGPRPGNGAEKQLFNLSTPP